MTKRRAVSLRQLSFHGAISFPTDFLPFDWLFEVL